MYKNILVPIDLSDIGHGQATLAIAQRLLDSGGAISVLNVVEEIPSYVAAELPSGVFEETMANAQKGLEQATAGSAANLKLEVKRGSPASAIIATAEEHGSDLIIVASHRPGLADYFLGSTASRVVRHAKCPVLVDR